MKDICIINENYIMHVYIYLNTRVFSIFQKENPLYKYINNPTYNQVVMIVGGMWEENNYIES